MHAGYVDSALLTVVPEPSSIVLLGMGAVGGFPSGLGDGTARLYSKKNGARAVFVQRLNGYSVGSLYEVKTPDFLLFSGRLLSFARLLPHLHAAFVIELIVGWDEGESGIIAIIGSSPLRK